MDKKFFTNENQLEDWVSAGKNLRDDFGINNALGYLIGEKFYNVVKELRHAKKMIALIESQRKNPGYNPIRTGSEMNLDEECEQQKMKEPIITEILNQFAKLIRESFNSEDIHKYFDSNPRFGALGHICSEEKHDFLIEKEATHFSMETEVEDAIILGEIKKYFHS